MVDFALKGGGECVRAVFFDVDDLAELLPVSFWYYLGKVGVFSIGVETSHSVRVAQSGVSEAEDGISVGAKPVDSDTFAGYERGISVISAQRVTEEGERRCWHHLSRVAKTEYDGHVHVRSVWRSQDACAKLKALCP